MGIVNKDTTIYADKDSGAYLGAYVGDHEPPANSIAVPFAPVDARQTWLGHGWSEPPAIIPASISRRQARLSLLQAGKLAAVESAIAAIPDPVQQMAAQIEYENATWERSNAWVEQLGAQIGLSPADIDQLFITAAGL